MDIGTSGFRCQAMDLDTGRTVSTAITARHPIPGMNVIDHVHFALESGLEVAHGLMMSCINKLFHMLDIDLSLVKRIGVCGNTFQLSLFQNLDIRDLAYAGKNMLEKLGIERIERNGGIFTAEELGIVDVPDAEVIIPPSVRHEIGADAIAMLLITGVVDSKEPCLVVDYGTNAEMALVCGDGRIFTGSAAAGPAMEGQQIEDGMLAAPGAISDINITDEGWVCTVLDDSMEPCEGDTIDPADGRVVKKGKVTACGITGTGTIASVYCGIESGILKIPRFETSDGKIHLQNGICITSEDVKEAGKAIGAMRAGFLTLLREAGMWTGDVKTAYMSGASGLYVDAIKAQEIGMVVPGASRIVQFGNTSIEMARKIVLGEMDLESLRAFAEKLKAEHCMFATSQLFSDLYSIEYSLWTAGMPMDQYDCMLEIYDLPPLGTFEPPYEIVRTSRSDLPDTDGCRIKTLESGAILTGSIQRCMDCRLCVKECPEKAISLSYVGGTIVGVVMADRCAGTACRRCERACCNGSLKLSTFEVEYDLDY